MSIVHCKHGVSIREECAECNVLWDARFSGPPPAKSGLVIQKAIKPPAQSDYLHAWTQMFGHYELNLKCGTHLRIYWPVGDDHRYKMFARFWGEGRNYVGYRDTLEEAFRAICVLLRREHADIFWCIDASVVVDNWRGELPCIK